MAKYPFHEWATDDDGYVLTPQRQWDFSGRLAEILKAYESAAANSEIGAPSLALMLGDCGGGQNTVTRCADGQLACLVKVSPKYVSNLEVIVAHEIGHDIAHFNGVPSAVAATETTSEKLVTTFSSVTQHPFVFRLVHLAGYRKEQQAVEATRACELFEEVRDHQSLQGSERTAVHAYIALGLFSAQPVAETAYKHLKEEARTRLPLVYEAMKILEGCWRDAKQSNPRDHTQRALVFQRTSLQALKLERYIELKTLHDRFGS